MSTTDLPSTVKSSTDSPLTIGEWVLVQAQGNGLERLLKHVASWKHPDPAWITKATPELIRSQWERLEVLQSRGGLLPLFGVPFAVKDNMDVQGLPTTAACPDFAYMAAEDASVISVLKRAGAILVGKTNLDQFATGLSGTRSPYGVVPNSFDERYISGGSSSGSTSVVARGLVPFALGSDTAGSGRVPAGLNNVVGLKPTRGALSTRGIVPACRSLDCVSILSLSIEDAELVLRLTAVYDEKDAFSRVAPAPFEVQALASAPRVAICDDPPWFGRTEQAHAYDQALESCREAGWALVPTDFSLLFELAGLLYEGPWVSERYAAIKDFISRPDVEMDPTVRGIISKARHFSSVDVFEGEYLRRELTRKIETQFDQYDAILVPTTPTFPTIQLLIDEPVMENSRLGTYTNFVNLLDWSALAFPAGFRADGLPFGLTLISDQWQEKKLLDLSRQVLSRSQRTLGNTGVAYQEIGASKHMSPSEAPLTATAARSATPSVTPSAKPSATPSGVSSATPSGTPKLNKILIANRGEIAVRIASSLKKLGIHSISMYSKDDQNSQHVTATDSSYLLEGTTVSETYLSSLQIIAIAKTTGAQAIIPGYGFLSENADFAEACEKEGIIWIGPSPSQMRTLGLKHLARELAQRSDVPLLPGTGILQNLEAALKEADRVGYPLMVKSTAGGGGIGLQKCSTPEELGTAFATVSHQGRTYFKDDGVFLEHFVEYARHIEVQVIGDGQGEVRHLGVRDCTLQRRNQKVVEESPATIISERTSERICKAALRLVQSISYRNVGTVEFLYSPESGTFYFLEVNTRLQVEHPVTEAVSGIDLVEAMVDVAAGRGPGLFKRLDVILPGSHAIEARIYAENPLKSFQPSTGTISECIFPDDVRVDTWIAVGTEITSTFDPLLAKIIVHGLDRGDAIKRLQIALQRTRISGVQTNLAYLEEIAGWSVFASNSFTTSSLATFEHRASVFQVLDPGLLTTVQDYPGRLGVWHAGIPPSSAMDDYSFRLANRILGNIPDVAGLECTSAGPTLLFHWQATIAITGAPAAVTIDDVLVPMFVSLEIRASQVLKIGAATFGFRTYLGIEGGVIVPKVFGSSSTFVLGSLGGHNGRALAKDDFLQIQRKQDVQRARSPATLLVPPRYGNRWVLHVLTGPHAFPDYFKQADYEALYRAPWKVHYNSNRIGVRLTDGPRPTFARNDGGEAGLHPSNIHDSPYSIGSISFTGDEAVIGTCDGPSLGGFLIFATVISADLWKIGQMKPGDEIIMCPISIDEAMEMAKELRDAIETLSPLPSTVRNPTIVNPIIGSINNHGRSITCRQSGDLAILLEFGESNFNIRSSFHIFAFIQRYMSRPDGAIKELTPGVRSIHVRYDPQVTQHTLISLLRAIDSSLGPSLPTIIPSRIISIPLVFEHTSTLAAVDRYARTIRATAPWLPNNVDFLARINALAHRDEILDIVLEATFLVLGLGDVFFGAPCAIPLSPRHRLFGTKYSPPRSFTPDGTVGIGGQYLCIYGMDSPGGYQLVGRTVPIWDRWAAAKGKEKMWMFEMFDRIRFYPVSESTLNEARASKTSDKLVRIEDGEMNLVEYEKWLEETSGGVVESVQTRLQKLQESGLVDELKQACQSERHHADDEDTIAKFRERGLLVEAQIAGRCWRCGVSEGDFVDAGQELISVESMKMEVKILAPRRGRVVRLFVKSGETLDVGDTICVLDGDEVT